MSDIAIWVENLSKLYHIGAAQKRHDTLRDVLGSWKLDVRNWTRRLADPTSNFQPPTSNSHIWALRDVSFEVKRGEVVGIIGRNGAGKSTLLKILSRITEPTTGAADIYGRVGSLLEVGTGFHPELTGRENIFLNGAILGMRRREIERKFEEIVSFAEVEKFIDTPVKRYSSGMYVRLAFAVAAHLEPEILVVDEVLAVGDAQFQKKCLGKMGDVAKEGRTVLFVSHNMAAIRTLCRKGMWIDQGNIVAFGGVLDIVPRYLESITGTSSSRYDLSRLNRRDREGKSLRLTSIEMNDGELVYHGEPLSIRIKYMTTQPVYGAAIGIGFNSLEGTRILSLDSDLFDERFDIPNGVESSVLIELPEFYMQPGRYSIDIGARSGLGGSLDALLNCFQIDVLPGPRTPAPMVRHDGGVRLPAKWTWESLPTFLVEP